MFCIFPGFWLHYNHPNAAQFPPPSAPPWYTSNVTPAQVSGSEPGRPCGLPTPSPTTQQWRAGRGPLSVAVWTLALAVARIRLTHSKHTQRHSNSHSTNGSINVNGRALPSWRRRLCRLSSLVFAVADCLLWCPQCKGANSQF